MLTLFLYKNLTQVFIFFLEINIYILQALILIWLWVVNT